MSANTLHQTGSFIGTGADLNVDKVGFRPRYVKVINETGLAVFEWFDSMLDDAAVKTVTAGTISKVTSNGITPRPKGFAVGADTDVNVAAEICHFVCYG